MLQKILTSVQMEAENAAGELGFGFLELKTGKSCFINGDQPHFPGGI